MQTEAGPAPDGQGRAGHGHEGQEVDEYGSPDQRGAHGRAGADQGRLAQRLALAEVIPGPRQGLSWDDSLQAASQEQAALWADDLALRHAARSVAQRAARDRIVWRAESGCRKHRPIIAAGAAAGPAG